MQISRYWRNQAWMYRLAVGEGTGAPRQMQEFVAGRGAERGSRSDAEATEVLDTEVAACLIQAELGVIQAQAAYESELQPT